MAVNLNLPSRQAGTTEQQLNGLYSYLYQLVEALNVSLNKDESGKQTLQKAGGGVVGGSSSPLPGSTEEEYQNLKALIVKTAGEVTSNVRKIVSEMTQEYRAQSEFGTYEEYLSNKISQGADGFLFEWDGTESVISDVGNIGQYFAETDAYIKFGIVKHNDDGTFEAGMVVGRNFQKVTVDGREYLRSEDVYALLTAEEISFWQSGVCLSRLSLTGLQASMAQLDKLIASVIESEGGDATLALDGGLLSAIAKQIDLTANDSIRAVVGALPTLKIHDGQLAQDESLADQGIRVYSEYSFEQAEGTPSPTNILPITGRSSAKLIRCGKNLFPSSYATYTANGMTAVETNNGVLMSGTPTAAYVSAVNYNIELAPGIYTVSGGTGPSEAAYAQVNIHRADGTREYVYNRSFEVYGDELSLKCVVQAGTTPTAMTKYLVRPQLEIGTTATDYEPYQGDTYEVDFGGTVYGGRLDWTTGVLTVDKGYRVFDGTENWSGAGTSFTNCLAFNLQIPDCAYNNNGWVDKVSSHAKTLTSSEYQNKTNDINGVGGYGQTVTFKLSRTLFGNATGTNAEHLEDFKAWLAAQYAAGTPVQIAYKLAEPYEIQLTPQQVWAFEGLNTVYADGDDGRIEFGHDSLARHLQSQIDLIPGQIKLAVVAGVDTGSGVTITKDEVNINSPKTTISIPAADSADGEEIVSVDDEGLRTTVLTADEIHSDSVVNTAPAKTYTPANAGELQVLLDELSNCHLTGQVNINAANIQGGVFKVTGLTGAPLQIYNGTLNSFTATECGSLIILYNVTFNTGETALTVRRVANVYLNAVSFSAAQGISCEASRIVMYNCTGTCTQLIALANLSLLQVTGSSIPYGTLSAGGCEVYSPFEFTAAPSAPSTTTVTTATLSANNTRTWGGSWLSTSTYGTGMYQGRYGSGELRRGCMWFDTSAISGKEIISATLTLKRVSGIGGGGAVTVGIYGTTATGASGTPAIGTKYAELSLANGATGSVDITEAVKALAAGSIKGLMIYDSRTGTFSGKEYTYGYCKVYGTGSGVPTISVTYK